MKLAIAIALVLATATADATPQADLAFAVENSNHDKHSSWIVERLMTLQLGDKCYAKVLDKSSRGVALIGSAARTIQRYAKEVTGDDWSAIEGQSANTKEANREVVSKMVDAFKPKFHVTLKLEGDDVVAEVMRLTRGLGCDLVVDHGKTEAIELGAKLLRKRGRFVVGAAYASTDAPKIDFGAICNQRELTFIDRTMSGGAEADCFARAIEYVRAGAIKLDAVVTHNLPLRDFQKALDISRRRLEHAIKVSMTP